LRGLSSTHRRFACPWRTANWPILFPCSRQLSKTGAETHWPSSGALTSVNETLTNREGFRYGKARSNAVSAKLNTTEVAAMPNPMMKMAATLKAGLRRNIRSAKRKSEGMVPIVPLPGANLGTIISHPATVKIKRPL